MTGRNGASVVFVLSALVLCSACNENKPIPEGGTDSPPSAGERLYPVFAAGQYGFMDKAGNLQVPCIYDEAFEFREGLARVSKGERYFFIDAGGVEVIKDLGPCSPYFANGLLRVQADGKWGYCDRTGAMVISPRFDTASDFSDSRALVSIKASYKSPWEKEVDVTRGYIDKTGKLVISRPGTYGLSPFSEGLAAFYEKAGEPCGYMDKEGKVVIAPAFDRALPFSEGMAAVAQGGKWGYINAKGVIVIEPRFSRAESFREGLAPIKSDGKWGLVEKSGKVVLEPSFDALGRVSEGVAAFRIGDDKSGKWGYVNTAGQVIVDSLFDDASAFDQGLAQVRVGEEKWHVDTQGKRIGTAKQ
jgi:hypothetical protein